MRSCRGGSDGSVRNLYNDDYIIWFHNFFNQWQRDDDIFVNIRHDNGHDHEHIVGLR